MAERPGEDGVEAVVFDLDGVLLESEQVWAAAKRELTERCGGSWKRGSALLRAAMNCASGPAKY